MGKIKAGKPALALGRIPPPQLPADTTLHFSFKYLDLDPGGKFCISRCAGGYLSKFLERLRDICQITIQQFRTNHSSSLKAHKIDWERTSEPKGFQRLNEQLRANEPWQFEITRNEHGRVHGILVDATFYVIWVDAHHLLFPKK